jgi:glycosyltransferase involved in cell wall biosynthesis
MRLFDSRWEGQHGIGRFAFEVGRRLAGFERASLSGSPAAALDPIKLTMFLKAQRPRLFLSPGYNAPLGAPCPFVFCIHDLNHLVIRENSSLLKRAYYQHIMKPAIRRAEVILTVSEFTRHAICEWAGVPGTKVHNVGNGISDSFLPAGSMETESPFFLYVGNHKPHKNFDRLLQAFAMSGTSGDFILISTGAPSEALQGRIAQLKLTDRVKFVGQISDETLASFYQRATAVVLVSLYEGFGLPLVEAMACGAPTLTSNVASMPEVVLDAGLQVDPLDVGAIAQALARLASDPELRHRLSISGLARAKSYSWDTTARLVTEAISSCA